MISEMFGTGGILEQKSRSYEIRPGQVEMARAVERAIREKQHLAVEAPCGIGKTYAYLVPAIEHALATDTRVIVCTANIALQEQIFEKDLPALARLWPRRFTYALIKGINNYLCLDRFEETRGELGPISFDRKELRQWDRIVQWRGETRTGDLSDLAFEPEDSLWNRVNGVSELCNGSECRFYEECFAMDARRKLRGAQVIVTNYHLFFAHLRVKGLGAGDVILPTASTVICDEAHDMADIARDFFGQRLGPFSIHMLVRGAHFLRHGGMAERLRQASRAFFLRVREGAEKRLRRSPWIAADDLLRTIAEYKGFLADARGGTEDPAQIDKIAKFQNAAEHYTSTLQSFLALDDPNSVYWVEKDEETARMHSRVIDVSPVLEEQLFRTTPSVILTSATLSASGQFDFVKRETGATQARELRVDSPFDFREQALLVVPRMKTSANDPGFAEEVSEHLNRIIRFLGGRTLCLFTSYRNLTACAQAAVSTGVRILRQGDQPRSKLLKEFRRDQGTALFATSSFWQGVDIPGEALSCLAIDKIPFMNPGDPLLEALQERDPACFTHYSLPKATLDLRQGFGRLIRRRSDRGVVVIFDTRLFTKAYGGTLLSSLPPCPVSRDLESLEKFFKTDEAPVE
jgi:ATP-dependent DNA helicase DinG